MADVVGHAEHAGHAAAPDHGGHGHGHHSPNLAHHWDTPAQQFDAGKLGIWLFLATEVLFFAGLFCAYAIYRRNHPHIFLAGQHFLDVKMGAINTIVLIASSFTMAMGVYCAQRSKNTGLIICLFLTLLGAFAFMGIKYVEYSDKIMHGKIWGPNFNPQRHDDHGHAHGATDAAHADGHAKPDDHGAKPDAAHATDSHAAKPADAHATPAAAPAVATSAAPVIEASLIKPAAAGPSGLAATEPHDDHAGGNDAHGKYSDPYKAAQEMRDLHIFMGIYFCMTGLHGIHVLGGIVVITWLIIGAFKGRYNSEYYTPVDFVGLYWHLVDLVWIYLFPLLYLIH
ncbi:MAG: cytochrome c oxidase subunit 3 [Phycisphaerae bacterium]